MSGAGPIFGDDARWTRSLDGEWSFLLVDSPDAAPIGFEQIDLDQREGWSTIPVPSNWAMHGHDAPIYTNIVMPWAGEPPSTPDHNPTGLYRRDFRLPPGWSGRRIHLRIGAAESVVHLWVNGVEVGFAKDSRLPSEFDITDQVRRGANTIALAVVQFSDASWIEDQDQWWLGGLHRSITVSAVAPTYLADVAVLGDLSGPTNGSVTVDATVAFTGSPEPGWSVETRLLKLRSRAEVPIFAGGDPLSELLSGMEFGGSMVRTVIDVTDIEPWSAERPSRYRVIVSLVSPAGETVDVRSKLIGFRRVEIADNELRINGQPVLIWGVNYHEHHDRFGRVVPIETLRADLELMKQHHVNAVRASHYPHQEAFYDLCDELGLYVIDEANVESHARQASLCHDPRYVAAIVERGIRMVVRDRSHPCIVAWSLGNEAGYGVAHDAMAAAIRRLDPSRPLHYEGALMHDLYAAAPVTDIVCPMYPEIATIVEWATSGRDARRPLIMCEYSHAMGNSNGSLSDYAAAFHEHHGLQGGFIWEWLDHGIVKENDDAVEYWGYGGDFGEGDRYQGYSDTNFCCDGLVWPDRTPHPALSEFKKLAQPIEITTASRGRLRLENRQWFTDLHDVRCRWTLAVDGVVIERGRLELPACQPGNAIVIDVPSATKPAGSEATMTFTFTPGRRPSWAPSGWELGWSQVSRPVTKGASATPWKRRRSGLAINVSLTRAGIMAGTIEIPWPQASIVRAPTDNDGLKQGWMEGIGARGRWRRAGLFDLSASADITIRGAIVERMVTWSTPDDRYVALHHQRVRLLDGSRPGTQRLEFREVLDLAEGVKDVARVGMSMELPGDYETLVWFGLGPHETYPDRCAAPLAIHRSTVTDQYVPYVVPQEHGHHHDTRWAQLSAGDADPPLRIGAPKRFGFSALHHRLDDLAAAHHTVDLLDRNETIVQIDHLHRGLGTASCGPDVLDRYRIGPGPYAWSWSIDVG